MEQYITEEQEAYHVNGPVPPQGLHVNRLGAILKDHTPGKWRIITDLSHPPGVSVNDGIDPACCSLTYLSVEAVAQEAAVLGTGALMAKVDVESAYRLIPIHPDDHPLLGFSWQDNYFCDGMLPFGLRSAPIIFTAVANAIEWCVRREGVQ